MTTFDATQATCRVFTFKDGALSALAHDLELAVGRLTIEVGADLAVDARFDATSLTVLHAMKDGRAHDSLSSGDKQKIGKHLATDVLDSQRYPDIRFRAATVTPSGDGFVLAGELTLHGRSRPLEVRTRAAGGTQVAEVTLHQPDFGIKPFSAMLGTLKVKADLKVRVTLPWPPA